jgi:hypothetical protein
MTRRTLTPAHDLTPTADTISYEDSETDDTPIEETDTDVPAEQYNITPTLDSLDTTERSQIAF